MHTSKRYGNTQGRGSSGGLGRLLGALALVQALVGFGTAHAQDACEDIVVLRGPTHVLDAVAQELLEVGVPTTSEAVIECTKFEVELIVEASGLRVILSDSDGQVTSRSFQGGAAICATWIESRYASAHAPLALVAGPPQDKKLSLVHAAARAFPSGQPESPSREVLAPGTLLSQTPVAPRWSLNLLAETSFDELGAQGFGLHWSACQRLGAICLGGAARSSLSVSQNSEFSELFGLSMGVMGIGEVPLQLGSVRVTPRAGVGLIRNSWRGTGQPLRSIDCTEIDCQRVNYGLNGELGADVAIPFAATVDLVLGGSFGRQVLYGSSDISLPQRMVRVAMGIRGRTR